MQICDLCGIVQEYDINYANFIDFEETKHLVNTIRGLLNQRINLDSSTNWICVFCEKQAKATQQFLILVERGQQKLLSLFGKTNETVDTACTLFKTSAPFEKDCSYDNDTFELLNDKHSGNENEKFISIIDEVQEPEIVCNVFNENSTVYKNDTVEPIGELYSCNSTILAQIVLLKFCGSKSQLILVCKQDQAVFFTMQQFWEHFEDHENSQQLQGETNLTSCVLFPTTACCLQCTNYFVSSEVLHDHHLAAHRQKSTYKCFECSAEFKSKWNLKYHQTKHSEEKLHQCNNCDKKFVAKYELNIHKRTHTGEKPYKCEVCDKSFAHASNARVHVRLHSNQRPFKCTTCEARFNSSSHLKAHNEMHLKQCYNRLNQTTDPVTRRETSVDVNRKVNRSLLKSPQMSTDKIQIVESQNSSSTFDFSLTNASDLNTKKQSQLRSDYKFQCTDCWKYFKQRSALQKHVRTHTGEKPYKCALCPKVFADPSNFKRHKMLHKNATDALRNITARISVSELTQQLKVLSRENALSPTHSTVSDPDPDGLELMQRAHGDTSSISDLDDDYGQLFLHQLPALLGDLTDQIEE